MSKETIAPDGRLLSLKLDLGGGDVERGFRRCVARCVLRVVVNEVFASFVALAAVLQVTEPSNYAGTCLRCEVRGEEGLGDSPRCKDAVNRDSRRWQ
jgi:hypothetical protein